MSDSVQPHRRQPTGLPHPWDSPGKNTGVGCHFLLQCMKVKNQSEVAQSCPTLSDPMGYSLPSSSVHGTFQARVLEWGTIAFSNTVLEFSSGVSNSLLPQTSLEIFAPCLRTLISEHLVLAQGTSRHKTLSTPGLINSFLPNALFPSTTPCKNPGSEDGFTKLPSHAWLI